MDVNKILNALIAALIPSLNEALPKFIVSEGLDPWDEVDSGSDTLGKIDLGVCTASVKASYSIKDMVGLSSTVVTTITLKSVDSSKLPTVTGVVDVAANLSKSLSAKLSGKLTAKCGVLSESASISGSATATGVRGTGQASFTANLTLPDPCLTQVTLNTFTLSYDHITVKISGLGIFNEFLDPLVDVVNALFGSAIKGEIATALRPVLNDVIKDELPLCISASGD